MYSYIHKQTSTHIQGFGIVGGKICSKMQPTVAHCIPLQQTLNDFALLAAGTATHCSKTATHIQRFGIVGGNTLQYTTTYCYTHPRI